MATALTRPGDRPCENFRAAIDDPHYFFGRQTLLDAVTRSPFRVRILLGGRRSGKTSTLNAIRWSLLNVPATQPGRALPVLFNLQQEQPKSLDNLRYLLVARLQDALETYKKGKTSNLRQSYNRLLRQLPGGGIDLFGISLEVKNPDVERELIHEDFRQDLLKLLKQLQKQQFEGGCFLIDGAEFIVTQDWANDAWSYFRALKDTDTALKPFIGLFFSGYRNLKEYQQRVGSPLLNIAELDWLSPLKESDIRALIGRRQQDENVVLTGAEIEAVITWAGGHPYLTQQVLNLLLDDRHQNKSRPIDSLIAQHIRQCDRDFSAWWSADHASYGFSQMEQTVYLALAQQQAGSVASLAKLTELSLGNVADVLEVLVGTGVVLQVEDDRYQIGARLFQQWVTQERG